MPYLRDVVLVQAPLQADPGLGLQVGDLLHHLEDVRHLLDGNHLLVPQAHPQVADALDGGLDVRLLVRLHVDVTFDVVGGDHRLDLQRLWEEEESTLNRVLLWLISTDSTGPSTQAVSDRSPRR